jgi:hypothetical protein
MKDLTGLKFGKLTVTGFSHKETKYYGENKRPSNKYYWFCKCDCGNEVVREASVLKDKKRISMCIDCRKKESRKFFLESNPKKSHGMTGTRIYKIYCKIHERCYNINYPERHLYGGRGIEMCDEWKNDFSTFYKWAMENGYNDNLSIDRIDSNGNYCPENCRWANNYEQANNKRNNIVLTYNGETMTMSEWARKLNLPYSTLADRRRKGKSVEEILYPKKKR